MGIVFDIAPMLDIMDGIEAVRRLLPNCWFDEERCEEGIKSLENYRKDRNERYDTWRNKPRHDKYSHGADAFRTMGIAHQWHDRGRTKKIEVKQGNSKAWT